MLIPSLMFALVLINSGMTQSRLRCLSSTDRFAYASSDTMDTTLSEAPTCCIQTCFNACSVVRAGVFLCVRRPRRCLPPGEKELLWWVVLHVNIKPSRRIAAASSGLCSLPARRQAMRNRRRPDVVSALREGERCFLPFSVLHQ